MNPNGQFQDIVAKSREILVVLPDVPTFDQVAAALALHRSFASFGKKSFVFCPSPMLVEYNRLVGVDKVDNKLGEKNLAITLRDYPAANIERVSYDIENGEMKLTIIPKENVQAPVSEQVGVTLSGMSADTAILIGIDGAEQLGEVNSELAKIPQKVSISKANPSAPFRAQNFNRGRSDIEIVDGGSSSLSETVGQLIFSSNLPLDSDGANNLFMGLASATSNFTSRGTRAETFELASKLVRVKNAGEVKQGATTQAPQQMQEKQDESRDEAPQDWFKPKVYKGTTMP